MIDLLVVSHACFMAINRNVYQLFLNDGKKVELVVPSTLNFPSGKKQAEPKRDTDPPIHYLALTNDNPRTYLFDGLDRVLEQLKPKIILLDNDPVSRLALVLGKWAKKNNAKLYCISCENLPLDIVSTFKRRGWASLPAALVKRILLHRTKKVVDGVLTINSDGKKIFAEEGYNNVQRMPLGFDPHYFFPDDKAAKTLRNQLGVDKKVIAYFGRLTPEKGVHILIKALEGLLSYEWVLMMDDFDEYASAYNKEIHSLMKEAKLLDRTVFISPNHFEVAGYMNAADIIVVPSVSAPNWKEQYGRVAAEAMACGKKVVASDSGALPELLNGNGWLFAEGNIDDLRQVLVRVLTTDHNGSEKAGEAIAAYAKKELSIFRQKEVLSDEIGFTNHSL